MPIQSKKRWMLLAAAVGLVAVFVLFKSFKSVPASYATLTARDAVETVLATGRIVGEKTIPLGFIRPGRIDLEAVQDGDQVKAGQVLMRLDIRQDEIAVALKRTALAVAKLNLEKMRTVDVRDAEQKVRQAQATASYADDFLKRQTELYYQKAIAQFQFDTARRDKELAGAVLDAAQNQLQSLQGPQKALAELEVNQAENDLRKSENDLRDAALAAPFDGRIVDHAAHKGQFVTGGQRIITFIPDTPKTYAEIQVDENNAGRLRLGQIATVSSPAFPGRVFPASVERLGAIVDNQRGTFTVRLALDKLERALLPESSVSVQIVTGEAKGVLLLEQRFIVRDGQTTAAFVAEGNRAVRRTITVRDLGNGQFGVESGLRDGALVLLPQGLKDGSRIKVAPIKN
jgi:multidrug efflux pump subunit AcrA (membrane-fusion protein)